jgi:hypothetical protein
MSAITLLINGLVIYGFFAIVHDFLALIINDRLTK